MAVTPHLTNDSLLKGWSSYTYEYIGNRMNGIQMTAKKK